jgi:glycosyltransferase involved in cell wall biosynthesis
MKKNIWIINEYAGSPYHGMEFRHFYLSKELQKLGYNPLIITASYSHLFKQLPSVKNKYTFENVDGVNYLWIKVPHYPQSHSKRRVLKWFNYTNSLYYLPVLKMPKPDYILISPMQTLPIFPVLKWAKKFNSKLIFEVKDIWPLSIIELGGYSPKHPFIRLLKYTEKVCIKKSDAIVSVLPNYSQYLKEQGFQKRAYYIPNGIDINELQNIEPLNKEIASQIPEDKFIVGYAGTIGIANALNYLVEAAKLLKDNSNIVFVVVGNGSEKEHLIKQSEGLNNIKFLPAIPKRQIQSLLQKFDVCFVSLQSIPIYKYGISFNKLFDYMYSGKPILFFGDSPNNVVEQANCGIVVPPSSPKDIAESVIKLFNMSDEERKQLGNNGKTFVLENHTFEKLAKKYSELLEDLKS